MGLDRRLVNELDKLSKTQVISLTRPKLFFSDQTKLLQQGELGSFRIPSQDTSSLFAIMDVSPLSMLEVVCSG